MVDDADVQYLEARVRQLEMLVQDLLTQPPAAAVAGGGAEEDLETVYPNLEAWMAEEFAPTYVKPIGGDFRWCPRWWEHVEAVSRLESLWRAWEKLRLDPVFGMAVWYRDYLDISLQSVTGPRGPFARCSPERHEPPKPLPLEPAPPGYWDWPDSEAGGRQPGGWASDSPPMPWDSAEGSSQGDRSNPERWDDDGSPGDSTQSGGDRWPAEAPSAWDDQPTQWGTRQQ